MAETWPGVSLASLQVPVLFSDKPAQNTVEPRFNEVRQGTGKIGSLNRGFVISRFVFHKFYCDLISLG